MKKLFDNFPENSDITKEHELPQLSCPMEFR